MKNYVRMPILILLILMLQSCLYYKHQGLTADFIIDVPENYRSSLIISASDEKPRWDFDYKNLYDSDYFPFRNDDPIKKITANKKIYLAVSYLLNLNYACHFEIEFTPVEGNAYVFYAGGTDYNTCVYKITDKGDAKNYLLNKVLATK